MTDTNESNNGTDTTKPETDATKQDQPQAAAPQGAEATPEASAAPAPSTAPPDPVATLTAERDRYREQLVRTLADFDNYRKRARRDEAEAVRRGKEDVLRELLPVFDNLERAANAAQSATDPKAVAEGVQMVLRLFQDTLTRLGGTRLAAVGQPFDPNQHEAIQQVESDVHAAGVVAQEMVPGYQFGERLLRPAMVVVSKGPGAPKGGEGPSA